MLIYSAIQELKNSKSNGNAKTEDTWPSVGWFPHAGKYSDVICMADELIPPMKMDRESVGVQLWRRGIRREGKLVGVAKRDQDRE
ncbi:hypothetical protein N7456_008618 [Penicillium angulare]|uniref:Uncharacterized protein n=1 Tax=Penicillium angulare TaxID=116970 RepID=A0A9W9F390_9EURO|nr:hypothetical protein N7456_008618 [Penicillium angulare]